MRDFNPIQASRAMAHSALASTYGPRDQFFDPIATAAKQFVAEQAIRLGWRS